MPSHPKGKQTCSKDKRKSGPLKRSGKHAKTWDESVGPSISVIPGNQLPQIKNVLQRYRALRIEQPCAKTSTLASQIAEEVTSIWDRARIPTSSHQVVINKIVSSVEWWYSISKLNSESRHTDDLKKLLDIAPKLRGKVSEERQLEHLCDFMRQESSAQRKKTEANNYNWEVDFNFYIDQAKVRGAWAGPTDRLFERFREQFGQLQFNDAHFRLWTWPDQTLPHTFLVDRALHIRSFLSELLLEDEFGRDDYRELCELIIKYLGGQVIRPRRRPGAQDDDFEMRAPGALHHARFLASCLYIMKLVILADVAHNLVTHDILVKLERMALYICLFHGPWFLQARVPNIAPRLDFQIWEHMSIYRNIDGPVAEAVKKSLLRHLWYLTEELVVFGLFDDHVDHEVRDVMASKLNNTPRPNNFDPGKPNFPLMGNNPTMSELIGSRSWLLFHLLEEGGDWLRMPFQQWNVDQEYLRMKETVSGIEVVNDTAERGVKDIQDYANAARDGAHRGRIIIVANSHRVKLIEFSNNEMEENL